MNVPDESELLKRCRTGDPQAVEVLVERYQGAIFRLALAILDDPAEAEEAVKDSFISAVNRPDLFQGNVTFRTFLFAVTINRCRARLRQRPRRLRTGDHLKQSIHDSSPTETRLEESIVAAGKEHDLRMAVKALDEKRRFPVILRYYHELPITEIAQVLRVNERAVHNRLRSAHLEIIGRLGDFEK